MGAEDGDRAAWDFFQFLDETRAFLPQAFHHVLVVDNLVPDVDGGAVLDQRAVDDLDRADHAGTEAPRLGEYYLHRDGPPTH